jgi:lysylphosphatidylglycerol synthetase-like protein (DUF2156 family)
MKQLFSQSKRHWFMFLITLFLAFVFQITNVIALTLFSLIIGILIELFQYINHAKVKYKTVDLQYIKFALFDILITVFAGFLGALIYNLYI